MKKIITTTIVAACLFITGLTFVKTTSNAIDTKHIQDSIKDPNSIKIMVPMLKKVEPTCPSAEYQIATLRPTAEYQDDTVITVHCTKCSIGAIFEREDGRKVCSYCEGVL
jgi:hypothetical protein